MALKEMKNAIQMGHLGNLAAIAASIPDGDRTSRPVGYVIGNATGLTYRANPNGDEPSIGLTGLFEATPVTEGMPIMVAPVIFLPKGFMDSITPLLARGTEKNIPKKAPPKGKAVNIEATDQLPLALEIGIRKNTGAGVGYEFAVTMLTPDNEKQDALASVRQYLPNEIARQSVPALPAPAAKAKRGKK